MVVAVGVGLVGLTDLLTASWANPTIWLILTAFTFSIGFVKSGLGKRIAYWMTRAIGDSTLKLSYALSIADLILSPATPSNTAREAGILFPIVKSLSSALGSEPGPTSRKAGSFLFMSMFCADCVTSAMFMTSMVSNPLMAQLAFKTLKVNIDWGIWFEATIVPGLVSLVAVPLFLYYFYPPELKSIPQIKVHAAEELAKMGPLTIREKFMFAIFVLTLGLWSTSIYTNLDATFIAMLGMALMLMTSVITWRDVLEEKAAWDSFIWLGGIIGLAGILAKYGFFGWFASIAAAPLAGMPWPVTWILVVLIYFYAHYGFAGLTPRVVLLYAAFVTIAAAAGTPPFLAAFALAVASSLSATVTNYSCAGAAIFYQAGYVDQLTWYKQGFLVTVVNLVVWLGVGPLWWKVLGLW
jgi:DASS family divalent anion:Na+ symporter